MISQQTPLEILERRQLLAASSAGLDGSGNLVIEDLAAGGQNDTLTLTVSGGNLIISDPANGLTAGTGTTQSTSSSVSIPLASITGNIQVNTLGGDDTLTVNFGGGNISVPILFNGGANGAGGDELILEGGSFGSIAHTAVSGSEGSVVLDDNRISYTGLEPFIDNNSAVNRTFTFTGGEETITLSDSGVAGKTTIDSSLSESITFTNPTGSLTVYSGTGSDTINVTGLGSGFAATLNIDGNASGMSVLGTFDYTAGALGGEMDINPNGELVYISGGMGQSGWMRVNASNPSSMSNVILASGFGGGVAVDPATGRYASTNGSNTLRVFNANDSVYDTETITGLGGSLAAGSGTFGISTQGTDRFQIYNQATAAIVFTSGSTAVGSRVEYNPATHNYEVKRDGSANFFTLETSPFTTGTVPSDVNVQGVNSVTNRLYGPAPAPGQVSVLNGSTHALLNSVSGIANLRDVTVNSLRDRVYIGSDGQVLVYDGGLTTLLETFTLPGGYTIKRMEAAQGTDRLYVIGSKSGSPDRLFALLAGGDSSLPDGDIVNINGVTSTTGAVNVAGQRINLNAQVSGSNATLLAGDAITPSIATTAVSATNISLKSRGAGLGANGSPIVLSGTNLNTSTGGIGNQFLKATGAITIDATGLSAGSAIDMATIELDGGTFMLGGSNRVSDSTKLRVNGSTFAIGTNYETVNTLTLSSGSITGSSGVLTSTNTIETQSGLADVILNGTNGLTQTGQGTTLLNQANTYSGVTTISQGTLQITNSAALGSSSVTLNDSNTGNNNNALLATSGMTITNAITVANQGSGVSTIGTDPSVTGNVSVFFNTPIVLEKDVTLTSPADASFNRTHYRSGITGTGNVTVTGGGRTIWSTSTSGLNYVNGSADYSFAGNIAVTGTNSVLQFNSDFASGAQSLATKNVDVGSGAFLMLPYNVDVTINGLTGSGRVHSYSPLGGGSAPATLTVGANGGSSTFDGTLTDNNATDGAMLALTKVGGGTLTLSSSSSSTATGPITIDGGTLVVNGSTAAASLVTVNNTSTLSGTGTVNGSVIVASGGNVSPGPSTGKLTVGSANFSAGGTLVIEVPAYGTAGTNYDQLAVIGNLRLGGTSTLLLDLNGLADDGTATGIATCYRFLGTPTDTFTTVTLVNNAYDFDATPTYHATALDYTFTLRDFGDAPNATQSGFANSYPTLLVDDGARHEAIGPTLGAVRDTEIDGQPATNASGDDSDGTDDEDGVTFGVLDTRASGSNSGTVTVNLQHADTALLDAWIDFNHDGIWVMSEQIATSAPLVNGDNVLNFTITSGTLTGTTYSRFRVSSAGGSSPTGLAADGEVEDHALTILPRVRVNSAPSFVLEDGSSNLSYTFRRPGTSGSLTVTFQVSGTAEFGSDYSQSGADSFSATTGTVTFADGSDTATVTIDPTSDGTVESNETVVLTLVAGTGYTIGGADPTSASSQIRNDDTATFTIDSVQVGENETATFTVSLSNPMDVGATVEVSFQDETATGSAGGVNADYDNTTRTLSFAANDNSPKTVTVSLTDDEIVELDETFLATLLAQADDPRSIDDNDTGVGTISDNDKALISIDDASVTEGGVLNFTVSLSKPASVPITVEVQTAHGSTEAGDFTPLSQTVTFQPGETSQPVAVTTLDDSLDEEPTETMFVNLSQPKLDGLADLSQVDLGDAQGQGTISDNDAPPTVAINDVMVLEPTSGTVLLTFTVSLSAASEQTVKINYATANNSAVAPGDYTATSGTLTFAPGQTSKPVAVTVKADSVVELNERFFVNLTTPVNVTIADSQGIGTIVQKAIRYLHFSGDHTIHTNEGVGTFNLSVDLTNAVKQPLPWINPITVTFTSVGTAKPGSDYTLPASNSFTIPAGVHSILLPVTITNDQITELTETFYMILNSTGLPSNIVLGAGVAVASVQITDNDGPINNLPSSITIPRNTSSFINGVSITATGAGANPIQLMLIGSLGQITLGPAAGLTFVVGTGTNDVVTIVRGTVSAINTALAKLRFTPLTDYTGSAARLTMYTSDLGNNPLGIHFTDLDIMTIIVR